ncbi:NUDIX domain-containing protein [Novosphingobium bradum]|uniref:NUDIX domain-containing protein n=1 Tax=Novosphingobium bradum TaxID=1737444 RepID=A0ABV7IUS6_9SPHN
MLIRLLPAPVHIAGLRLAHAVRRQWWRLGGRLGRPPVRGCRVLVFDAADRLLLIRHSYGAPHWTLPGGGLGRGEDALAAARREVREETACHMAEAVLLGLAGQGAGETLTGRHEVHLVAGWTADAPCADGREIVAAAFFALDALPQPISARLAADLPGHVTTAKAARPSLPG